MINNILLYQLGTRRFSARLVTLEKNTTMNLTIMQGSQTIANDSVDDLRVGNLEFSKSSQK